MSEERIMQAVERGGITGWIYYIACTETQRVKIGYTACKIEKRLKALQTGSPTELVILAMHPGSVMLEQAIHDDFADRRVRGEWFQMDERLMQHLCASVCLMAQVALNNGREIDPYTAVGLHAAELFWGELPQPLRDLGLTESATIQ